MIETARSCERKCAGRRSFRSRAVNDVECATRSVDVSPHRFSWSQDLLSVERNGHAKAHDVEADVPALVAGPYVLFLSIHMAEDQPFRRAHRELSDFVVTAAATKRTQSSLAQGEPSVGAPL